MAWAPAHAPQKLKKLGPGDVLMVTRIDRLARSTRDLLNTLAAIADRKAGFRSLGDAWADTTISHGRLMLTVLGGLVEFERDLIRARAAILWLPALVDRSTTATGNHADQLALIESFGKQIPWLVKPSLSV